MQAVISRMAEASDEGDTAPWKTAALPSGITGDPWELEDLLGLFDWSKVLMAAHDRGSLSIGVLQGEFGAAASAVKELDAQLGPGGVDGDY